MAAAKKTYQILTPVRVDGKLHREGTIDLEDKQVKGIEHCLSSFDKQAQAKAAEEAEAKAKAEADSEQAAKTAE